MSKIWWNITVASLVFVLTFVISASNNTWMTAFVRSVAGFIFFFIVMYPIRWCFAVIMHKPAERANDSIGKVSSAVNEETPEEDLLSQISEGHFQPEQTTQSQNEFTPLSPPIIQKKNAFPDMTPEDMANAVRALSNE